MSKDIILKAENISKQYRLGQVGTGTLTHDINRWWHQLRGKENPYLKVGDTNDRSTKGTSEYVWALQDINFEVERGEVLGIIGKNGAGKSTLLKILSKVTAPTTGSIKSRGRIASLLEVGTGFNGEMTGRENIFLNGAILGMTKKEIASKLDEIIEFSGCERYIDTPVKRYSSGMTVRLAFAVAAFLEPEILVIDEVLAVGDAEFQKKAIGKMQDISKGEGRTVLFVSHNMAAVKQLCTKGIVMENGKVVFEGNTNDGINYYLSLNSSNEAVLIKDIKERKGKGDIKIVDVKILDRNEKEIKILRTGEKVVINIYFESNTLKKYKKCRLSVAISNQGKDFILLSTELGANQYIDLYEKGCIEFVIPKLPLTKSNYNLEIFLESDTEIQDWIENALLFSVEDGVYYDGAMNYPKGWEGKTVLFDYTYSIKND
ncbi:ABC transporter ATP-binding protein [Flavobacterium aquidurense]|uniref:ABC transporter ATP-binding protein n=1 Tax=Flavobacterium aquidurense TaxID=362413 RepID=UPI002857FBD0|nr:ABC transporter ATP-binding protein [Flavobacterium aquidurense]MDR7372335.1 lipopolysaccharide transport system ATP-binding protein [Flavobacterium aquidurense]